MKAQTPQSSEYALKAVFLYNFTQFVDWPKSAFTDSESAIVIGVLGDDPYGIYLDETVRDEKVNNRPLLVERYKKADEVKNCHILYISESEAAMGEQIVKGLSHKSVLTVSDAEGFSEAGVIIRFDTEKKKIKLKIDVDAAKAADLNISSKLLRLADVVSSNRKN